MLLPNRLVFLSNTINRRLIHGSSVFCCLIKQKTKELRNPNTFVSEKLLVLSSNSIKPYLNENKLHLLKPFYQTENDLTCTYSFIKDENVAKDVAKHILTDEGSKERVIVEGNPGLGLITVNLINSSVPQIFVYDYSEIQEVSLNQLTAKHPQKITKKTANMHKSLDSIILSSLDFGQQHNVPVAFVGVSTGFSFIKGLVLHFIKYDLWESNLNVFLAVSSQVWNAVNKNTRQKNLKLPMISALRLFFTIEELAKYPRTAFLPLSQQNDEDMYLIKISVNQKGFEIIDRSELNDYLLFLKVLGSSSSNYVIPTLEKWLPNCGPHLIAKGISLITQVKDLSIEEAVFLYNFFKQCDGYSDFRTSISHIMQQQ